MSRDEESTSGIFQRVPGYCNVEVIVPDFNVTHGTGQLRKKITELVGEICV
jgi:hypothetical protein